MAPLHIQLPSSAVPKVIKRLQHGAELSIRGVKFARLRLTMIRPPQWISLLSLRWLWNSRVPSLRSQDWVAGPG